jgi:hypothetical protein
MNCPFLLKSDRSTWCEILLEKASPERASLALSQCTCKSNNPEECLEFKKVLAASGTTRTAMSDRLTNMPAWRIGHINRLGGRRLLEPDLQ